MSRILNTAQINLAAKFAVGYGIDSRYWNDSNVVLTPKLEAMLSEQDRVSYEVGRQDMAREIFGEIEKHLKEYQWVTNPDDSKRHYPYCPTDFEALKAKYLKPEVKL